MTMTTTTPTAPAQRTVDPAEFRAAMTKWAAGIAIVTTRDAEGNPHGFTATSVCSLSMEPPLILVCLAKSARCHTAFDAADHFAAALLRPAQEALAMAFGRGLPAGEKFGHGTFTPTVRGIPVPDDALAVVECAVHARYDGGDHTILLGRVESARVGEGRPAVYFDRAVHVLEPAAAGKGA
jgi:flavin reductase ActVB